MDLTSDVGDSEFGSHQNNCSYEFKFTRNPVDKEHSAKCHNETCRKHRELILIVKVFMWADQSTIALWQCLYDDAKIGMV